MQDYNGTLSETIIILIYDYFLLYFIHFSFYIYYRFEAPSSLIPTYTWLNGPGSIFDEPNTYLRGAMTPTESPHFEEKSLFMHYRKFKEREGSVGSDHGLSDISANTSENGKRSLGRNNTNPNRQLLSPSSQTWNMSPPKSSLMKVASPLRGKSGSPNRSKSLSIDTNDNFYHDANHPISNSLTIMNDYIESRKSSNEPLVDNEDAINKTFGDNSSNTVTDVITAVPKPSRLFHVQLSTSLNHSSSNSNSISPSEFTPTINTPDRMEAAVAAATQRQNPNKNSIVRRSAELITYENSV